MLGAYRLQLQGKQSHLAGWAAFRTGRSSFIQPCLAQMSMWTSSGDYTLHIFWKGNGMIRERKDPRHWSGGIFGLPLVEHLAAENTVWAVARYSDSRACDRVAATRSGDAGGGHGVRGLCGFADDFDYVVHLVTSGSR